MIDAEDSQTRKPMRASTSWWGLFILGIRHDLLDCELSCSNLLDFQLLLKLLIDKTIMHSNAHAYLLLWLGVANLKRSSVIVASFGGIHSFVPALFTSTCFCRMLLFGSRAAIEACLHRGFLRLSSA